MHKILAVIFICSFSFQAFAVDPKEVEKLLSTTGAEGWVHASIPLRNLYVFTYRNPGNFFDYLEMSLVSDKPETLKLLAGLSRHDKVRIKGSFLDNPSPQKHIDVGSVEVMTKYQPGVAMPNYEYEAKIPDELKGRTEANFLVHAIGGDGHILVVEFKDAVLPIYVRNAELTKNLFRNDIVKLVFTMQRKPGDPTHLRLDEKSAQPLQVIESIQALHGKPAVSVEGALILFPKSPEIMFNVFAVEQVLSDGLKRQYTIVNFDSPDTFAKVRSKLQAAWDQFPNAYTNGRNKLVSQKVRVQVTGTYNVVDANQANAQILVKDAESVKVVW